MLAAVSQVLLAMHSTGVAPQLQQIDLKCPGNESLIYHINGADSVHGLLWSGPYFFWWTRLDSLLHAYYTCVRGSAGVPDVSSSLHASSEGSREP